MTSVFYLLLLLSTPLTMRLKMKIKVLFFIFSSFDQIKCSLSVKGLFFCCALGNTKGFSNRRLNCLTVQFSVRQRLGGGNFTTSLLALPLSRQTTGHQTLSLLRQQSPVYFLTNLSRQFFRFYALFNTH